LSDALVYKFGYETKEKYIEDAQKRFSLLSAGLLDKSGAPLLLANVSEVNKVYVALLIASRAWTTVSFQLKIRSCLSSTAILRAHGKLVYNAVSEILIFSRFIENVAHMGSPQVDPYILDWIDALIKPAL
jgi:hypothetical protein